MLALIHIPWHWAAFILCVLLFLALDLGVFHRRPHAVRFREALLWSGIWFSLALLFALGLRLKAINGEKESLEFLTGYLLELSLSMDNIFVIALIFTFFRVPADYQHRVLFWGILGALVMRGLMIGVGVALVTRLHWLLYLCGAFLVYSGIQTLFAKSEVEPEKSRLVRLVRKFCPISPDFDGQRFVTRWNGRRALTPLALVLMLVETSDLIFALDSVPAVFAVTLKPYIVYTSNIFAILGLRSLYFVLAGAFSYFRYLKVGLCLVLVFIGVKMLLDPPDSGPQYGFQVEIPISVSLLTVAGILLSTMLLSVAAARRPKP